jgi:hypothetical protein
MEITTEQLLYEYDKTIKYEWELDCFVDRALLRLLQINKNYIDGLIEVDSSGAWFHKAFRQVDVTESGDMDMAFWNLLQSTPLFWKTIERLNNGDLIETF